MLRTRIWMGALLIALGLAVLVIDVAPWYPGWLLVLLTLGIVGCREILFLAKQENSVSAVLCHGGVIIVLAANWLIHIPWTGKLLPVEGNPFLLAWVWLSLAFFVYFFALFLAEMAIFRRPSGAMVRMALSVWIVAYLGLLPSFLAQLRWLPGPQHASTLALILTIFVPKCCDMGAYFTGRFFGRTKMTPNLSPKKTWEGAVGGLGVAAIVAVFVDQFGPVPLLGRNIWAEIGFGITVAGAGILGDLGESLIKREYKQKDASQVVPGFGGVLDVIDAVLFAGPVAYIWLLAFVPGA